MEWFGVVTARRVALAAGTLATAVGVGALPAAASPSAATAAGSGAWSTPVTVIRNTGVVTTPKLVVNASGDGYVAISGPSGPLRGVAVASDGAAGAPQILAPATEHPRDAGLGISSSGTVTAAYTVGAGRDTRVVVRQGLPGALIRLISPPHTTSTLVSFQEAPDGFAGALLCIGDQGHCRYALYGRPSDGVSFRHVVSLPARARAAALAVASDGALVAWVSHQSSGRPIRALQVSRQGRASAAVTVARRARISPFFPLGLALVPGGGALVAWDVSQPGDRRSINVATRTSESAPFGPTRVLSTGAARQDTIELRVFAAGHSVLVCTSERQPHGIYRVVVRTWSSASGLGRARFASSLSRSAFDPFAVAGGGRTVVAWDGLEGVEAAMSTGGSAFGAPDALSGPTAQSAPEVAVDAHGSALAVWARYGSGGQVQLARLAPPA